MYILYISRKPSSSGKGTLYRLSRKAKNFPKTLKLIKKLNIVEIKHHCDLYASRHVHWYTLVQEDGKTFSFCDCSIDGVSSTTIHRATIFLGGYSLDGWSFRCGGPGYGFEGCSPRTLARGYAEQIFEKYPSMPEEAVIETACRMEDVGNPHIRAAVSAHARHTMTDYDKLLLKDMGRREARTAVAPKVRIVLNGWRKR